ncbi:TPR-like protein, partial [Stipitochalara longipes BDJ]
ADMRDQPTREEWMELKPMIWHLFIEEDINLQHVVELLREEKGLVLTKRQLTRRLKEWNFRKNTKSTDRASLLHEAGPSSDEPVRTALGIKVTAAKIERWKRKMKKEEETSLHSPEMPIITGDTINNNAVPPTEFSLNPPGESFISNQDAPVTDVLSQSPEESVDPWPFLSNSMGSGHDLLSRLFSALSIEPVTDVQSYATKAPILEADSDSVTTQYISSTEYSDLSKSKNTGENLVLRQPSRRISDSTPLQATPPSPFNKISWYPSFEQSKLASQRIPKPQRLAQTVVAQNEILELKERFSKLQGLFPETHPAMLAIVRGLADANGRMGNSKVAEHWWRQTVTINQKTTTTTPQRFFDHLRLIEVVVVQERFEEAKELFEQVEPDIKQNVSSVSLITDECLGAEALYTQAQIAAGLGSDKDLADYAHQLLQLDLTTLGPYSMDSLLAMNLVAESLIVQGNYDESIRILCMLLQLLERCKQTSEFLAIRRYTALRNLARALCGQARYIDSVALARRAVELAEELLGSEHYTTWFNMVQLGACLREARMLSESEAVYRDVLAKASLFSKDDALTMYAMYELGDVLKQSDCYEEATTWQEKAYAAVLQEIGTRWPENQDWLMWMTVQHIKCYQEQAQYEDATALYEQIIARINGTARWDPETCTYDCSRLGTCYKNDARMPWRFTSCRFRRVTGVRT